MLKRFLQITFASLSCLALLANAGCANCAKGSVASTGKSPCGSPCKTAQVPCQKPADELTAELPPHAKPGECWAKVFVPPQFKTTTDRVMVKEASEQIEIVPAKYEWVDEQVCVKDASTRLVEEPAEFSDREVTVQTDPAHTDWQITKSALCTPTKDESNAKMAQDVFCLVNYPENTRTIHTKCVTKEARVREEIIPAQYETVRREKLVSAATTRKTCIPAEYETVEKSVKVCDGRMAWQRVECDKPDDVLTINTTRNLDRD